MFPTTLDRTPAFAPASLRPVPHSLQAQHPGRRIEDRQLATMMRAFARTGGLLHGDEVARMLRRHYSQPLSLLARWVVSREIVHVSADGQILIPLFQFDLSSMTLAAALASVLRELSPVFDEWALGLWFASPSAWLSDRTPAEVLWTEPSLLLEAARADRYVAAG